MDAYKRLLLANKAWAQERLTLKPDFFTHLTHDDPAEFFWVGCTEAVVPPDEIAATGVGDIVVHRNLANLVVPGDRNMESCLRHALEVVKVTHVIVCGHRGCLGIREGLSADCQDPWLSGLQDLYDAHRDELDLHSDEDQRIARVVELNVLKQVRNLAEHPLIRKAWSEGERPFLHGWVFHESTGRLQDLVKVAPGTEV